MRTVAHILSVVGLAGASVAILLAAYSLTPTSPATDPADEIRRSLPESAVAGTLEQNRQVRPDTSIVPSGSPVAPVPEGAMTARNTVAGPRAVAPAMIAVPPVDPATLERIDPRPPLSELAAAPRPKKPPPRPLLFQPVGEAAGVIAAGGRVIAISGLEIVPDDAACERSGGGTWPCGRAARTAFRAFLRGRAVTCDFPEGEVPDRLTTTCRVGPRDIGKWLVENGWARASGDGYREEARLAREGERGVHGNGPPALSASPLPATPAGSDGQAPPEQDGPSDISILPDGTATGATTEGASGSAALPDGGADGVAPLPPPATPLR